MGITQDTLAVGPIVIPILYDNYLEPATDAEGKPTQRGIQFLFTCRRESIYEFSNSEAAMLLTGAAEDPVIRMARVVVETPQGFDDFPQDDAPLSERFLRYFQAKHLSSEKQDALRAICSDAWAFYRAEMKPYFFRRSVPNLGERSGTSESGASGQAA